MCSVTHVAVGALVGSFFGSSLASFLVGLASHIPLDIIPHLDFENLWVDAALTVALLLGVLVMFGFSPVFFGALGAVAPDLENLLWRLGVLPEERKIFPTHSGLLKHGTTRSARGFWPSLAMVAVSVAIVAVAAIIEGGRS
ncbi:MAG: hypothetical protein PVF95_05800 [bacterium]|jgi:hypothetical protein